MTEEAWYASAAPLPEGTIRRWSVGVHALTDDGQDDGTYGQWTLNWRVLTGSTEALRVEAFDDSWVAMAAVEGYWDAMLQAQRGGSTPEAVLAALVAIGFQDRTDRAGDTE